MANPLAKTLIAIVAACAAGGVASAQDDALFREAVRLLRTNKPDEALEKLREFLATDPGHEEAFELWQNTDSDVWRMMLMQKGEYSTVAKHLMNLATAGRKEASRDEDAIAALVETATTSSDFGERSKAQTELAANHGEFAVPALLAVLGNSDSDDQQDLAMLALKRIGSPAVQPLVQALNSDSDLMRRNVAASLLHIGDSRCRSAMARLAAGDSNESVREIARRAMERFGVAEGAVVSNLFASDAHQYLTGAGLRGTDISEVVWTWDGGLKSHDVPSQLYHLELAKQSAHEAMRLDPGSADAKSLLSRAYLAQAATIKESLAANPDDEAMSSMADKAGALRMVAMTTGTDTLRKAMVDSLTDHQHPVAVAAIEALGEVETPDSLGSSPLLSALDNADSNVAYAAALAMTNVAGASASMPNADRVVAVLGQAVTEKGRRLVKVIGGANSEAAAMEANSKRMGVAVDASLDAEEAVIDLFSFPDYDIIIVDEVLENRHPREVISLARQKAPNAKILLRAASEDAGEAYGDNINGVITGGLSGDALISKANELVEDLGARRNAANAVAVNASNALNSLAGKVDISAALGSLQEQLNRSDDIAIPAAGALGSGGTLDNVGSLCAVVTGDGSNEVKIASANAIGDILARSASVPTACFDAMIAIASNNDADMAIRSAVVTALGKGKLAPGERLKLAESLATIAQAGE